MTAQLSCSSGNHLVKDVKGRLTSRPSGDTLAFGHQQLDGSSRNLSRLIKIQREDVRESRGVGVEWRATVTERLQQQEDAIQLFNCIKPKKKKKKKQI